jgi:hypothetical protein
MGSLVTAKVSSEKNKKDDIIMPTYWQTVQYHSDLVMWLVETQIVV